MPIRSKGLQVGSVAKTMARNALAIVPANALGSGYIMVALAQGSMTIGTPLTLLVNITAGWAHSILFTPSAATAPWGFDIVGKDIFGFTRRENVAIPTATAVQSLYCYREITSITPTAKSSGIETMAIGWLCNVAAGTSGVPRIALPARIRSTGSVLSVTQAGASSGTTWTVIGAPYYALQIGGGVNPISNPYGLINIVLDTSDYQV